MRGARKIILLWMKKLRNPKASEVLTSSEDEGGGVKWGGGVTFKLADMNTTALDLHVPAPALRVAAPSGV